MDEPIAALILVAMSYAIGSVPVAYLVGRARGVDLRDAGSGNPGASNVFQSVSGWLVVPVGVAQIAQGLAGAGLARLLDAGDGVQVACAIAAVLANDWNPWLRFRGGRGIGTTIGAVLVLSPAALAAFIAVSLAGVAVRAIPQGVALALLAMPLAAALSGDGAMVAGGCTALAAIALVKRMEGNGTPAADAPRPRVWWWRLALDRDVADRDAWVRRGAG